MITLYRLTPSIVKEKKPVTPFIAETTAVYLGLMKAYDCVDLDPIEASIFREFQHCVPPLMLGPYVDIARACLVGVLVEDVIDEDNHNLALNCAHYMVNYMETNYTTVDGLMPTMIDRLNRNARSRKFREF